MNTLFTPTHLSMLKPKNRILKSSEDEVDVFLFELTNSRCTLSCQKTKEVETLNKATSKKRFLFSASYLRGCLVIADATASSFAKTTMRN